MMGENDRVVEERFADLDPETRRFLKQLRHDEIVQLREAIDFMRSVRTMGRFVRWSIYTMAGVFATVVAIREGAQSFRDWFTWWLSGGR